MVETSYTYNKTKFIKLNNIYFYADVLSVYNYYPFGMLQPDMYAENEDPRTRFGFNGMLRDDDIKDKFSTSPDDEGRGNSYATHFRMYDPRVARWFSIDPLVAQFPWTSPYTGMGNNPVLMVDPLGSETTESLEKNIIDPVDNKYQSMIGSIDKNIAKMDPTKDSKAIEGLQSERSDIYYEYNKFQQGVQELRDSDVLYDYGGPYMDKGRGGYINYDLIKGAVMLQALHLGQGGTIGGFRHVLQHMFQFERGQISFTSDGKRGGTLYDAMDEIEAYQTMHIFGEKKGIGLKNNIINLPPKYNYLHIPEKNIRHIIDFDNGMKLINRSISNTSKMTIERMKKDGEIFKGNMPTKK